MRRNRLWALVLLAVPVPALAAVDVAALWDTSDPAMSERRFREALLQASGDDALILTTQIARTYQLRRQFDQARATLAGIAEPVASAGSEARARYWLELGRTYASHRHAPEALTEADRARAKEAFAKALQISNAARLDSISVDVIHMCPFVETDLEVQLACNRDALRIVEGCHQPDVCRWEASIRSNLGESLFDLGRYPEALEEFRRSADLFQARQDDRGYLDSRWHVGRTLRLLGRIGDALAIQVAVQEAWAQQGQTRAYVFEELELLYRTQGDLGRANHYAELARTGRLNSGQR